MNLYQPHLMRIEEAIDETADTRTFKLVFQEPKVAESFDFHAGQFGEFSVFGEGECTFCIASSPTRKGYIECSFRVAGKVTSALSKLGVGDTIGFRGPYGNRFPVEQMEGRDVVFIAGGIGLAPVRCVIWNVLDQRERFRDVTILYGARSVADRVYKRELEEWSKRSDVKVWQTVDMGGETPDWRGEVGYVPAIVEKAAPKAADAFAVVCGPAIMIDLTLAVLEKLGFAEERIYTTLENRMKCGVGKCGRCNIGPVYVCKDGPVFSAKELKALPRDL
ncbi:MAG: FAD/NAD(P)-binding protein [Myxococcales bacterium]